MEKKSAGSENLIGVGGSIKDVAAKIWGQLVVGLLGNFKIRILGGWLSLHTSETYLRCTCKILPSCPGHRPCPNSLSLPYCLQSIP